MKRVRISKGVALVVVLGILASCGSGVGMGDYNGYSDSTDRGTSSGGPSSVDTGAPAVQPDSTSGPDNIALHATVTLGGGRFFTGGWGNGEVVDAGTVVDGVFMPRSSQWDQGAVWWDCTDGVERSITLGLGSVYKIESLTIQADDNDAYLLYYHDVGTDTWQVAWHVPNYNTYPDSSSWGMQTRPNPLNNAARYILPQPVVTDALMIEGDMSSGDRLFAVSEIQAFGVPIDDSSSGGGTGDAGSDTGISGYGTATIDGAMKPGEWDTATRIDFQANVPSYDGGGTTPATLYVMNDGTNLYFAVTIARTSFGGATNPVFEFDNNNNGIREDGDDGFGMYVGIYSPVTFLDTYRYTCPGSPAGSAGCSALDTETTRGILPAGTNDGKAAATNDGHVTVIELSHPLDSGDHLHDFSLKPGDSVGFHFALRLFSLTPACNTGPSCYADTDVPATGEGAYRHITVVSPN